MSDFLFDVLYKLIFYPFGMLFTLTNGLRVEGSRRFPKTGPVLIVANHQSYLDIILCGLACPRRAYFLARKSLWRNRFLGWIMDHFNTIPVDTIGYSRTGLDAVLDDLKKGRVVVIYPEGERTHDGKLAALKPGISLLIRKVKSPIVPVGIAGAYEALPRNRKTPHFAPPFLPWNNARIALRVGKPIDGATLSEMPREEMLKVLEEAMEKVLTQAERLRGNRQSVSVKGEAGHPQKTGK